jgi:hypothetical protein
MDNLIMIVVLAKLDTLENHMEIFVLKLAFRMSLETVPMQLIQFAGNVTMNAVNAQGAYQLNA